MDFFDLLFGPIGPSLQFIFKIGYIPNENDFLELTEDQYAAYVKQCGEIKGKIYMFSPQNPHFSMDDDYNEISCLDYEDLKMRNSSYNTIVITPNKSSKRLKKNYSIWLQLCQRYFPRILPMRNTITCQFIEFVNLSYSQSTSHTLS